MYPVGAIIGSRVGGHRWALLRETSAGNLNCGSRYDLAGATPPFFALCFSHFRVGMFQLHRKKVPADSPLPQPVAFELTFFPSVLKQDTQCPGVGL